MGQIQPPLPSLHSGPPSPVWCCQSCFCQNADISKRCQRLGVKLRGRAKLARCDFVQMCLASAFWLSIIPLNYLFYKADYVFTFAGQLGFFFSLQNCLLFLRMLSFFLFSIFLFCLPFSLPFCWNMTLPWKGLMWFWDISGKGIFRKRSILVVHWYEGLRRPHLKYCGQSGSLPIKKGKVTYRKELWGWWGEVTDI